MKFIPIVLIAILAFIIGYSVKNSFIAPFNAANEEQEASTEASLNSDQANLPALSGEAAPASSPTATHQLPNNSGSYNVHTTEEKITLNGNFRIPDFYKLNYTFIFPKNGGDVTGRISGVCEGGITGKSDKPDSDGEARIEGKFQGDCKPIPGLSFKTKASGTFEGQLRFKENKVHIIYTLNEPYQTRGGFDLFF